MKEPYDPIKAYLDGFYSWPVLCAVVAGMVALCVAGAPLLKELLK